MIKSSPQPPREPLRCPESLRQRAFTLIELLVVIAIIAILASLLFPMASRFMDRAKGVKCMSNLRRIGVAMNMFVGDHDGCYPLYNAALPEYPAWYIQLAKTSQYGFKDSGSSPIVYDRGLYCPVSGKNGAGGWPAHNPDYGMNMQMFDDGGMPSRMAKVKNPSKKVLIVDSGTSGTALKGDFRFNPLWNSLIDSGPKPKGTDYSSHGWMAFRHPQPTGKDQDMTASSCHALFCDGHLEAIAFSDVRLQTEAGRRLLFMRDE